MPHMESVIPDDDVQVLAQDMIRHFPADAALRAGMRSDALSVLGYVEKSKKWLLVRAENEKMQASKTQDQARPQSGLSQTSPFR